MKTFIFTTLLLIAATFSQAQDMENLAAATAVSSETTANIFTESDKVYSAEHNRAVVNQLRSHLAHNMVYPEKMYEAGIEGIMIIQVQISENGRIKNSQISKSLHPEFDKAALKVIRKMNKVALNGGAYQGNPVVNVPMKFRITP